MYTKPNLSFYYSCGEIFQKYNHEFLIVCSICKKNFTKYELFTKHSISCSLNKGKINIKGLQQQVGTDIKKSEGKEKTSFLKVNLANEYRTHRNPLSSPDNTSNECSGSTEKLPVKRRYKTKDTLLNPSKNSMRTDNKIIVQKTPSINLPKNIKPSKMFMMKSSNIGNKTLNKNMTGHGTASKKSSSIKMMLQVNNLNSPVMKRKRIIKKKIIWDPDAPESQIPVTKIVSEKLIRSLNTSRGRNQNKSFLNNVSKTTSSFSNKPLDINRKTQKKLTTINDSKKLKIPLATTRIMKKKIIWDQDNTAELLRNGFKNQIQ